MVLFSKNPVRDYGRWAEGVFVCIASPSLMGEHDAKHFIGNAS